MILKIPFIGICFLSNREFGRKCAELTLGLQSSTSCLVGVPVLFHWLIVSLHSAVHWTPTFLLLILIHFQTLENKRTAHIPLAYMLSNQYILKFMTNRLSSPFPADWCLSFCKQRCSFSVLSCIQACVTLNSKLLQGVAWIYFLLC